MATSVGREDKPPFDQLVNSVSPAIMRQLVGSRQEGQKFAFHSAAKKFRSAVKAKLNCDLDKFGSVLGLPAARVSELLSAADGDREKQIDYLVLAWVESSGESATVEEVLRAVYAADDTRALEDIANELSATGVAVQRNVIPKKPSYADSVVIPSPPTQTHFIGENGEMKISQRLAQMAVVPNSVPKRLESQSELTPVELPPDVSLQRPLEETPQTGETVTPVQPTSPGTARANEEKSSEAQMPVEESLMGPSIESTATSTVVTTFTTPQRIVTSDTAYEETKGSHEMVSGDRRMERMQSDLEELMKNMIRIETGLEEVKTDHRRESLYHKQRSDELDSKLKQLEADNETLKETVRKLQEELYETKQKLKEALEEVAKLQDDKRGLTNLLKEERAKLRDERERFQEETEKMRLEAATTEREKADLRESLEVQAVEWQERQQKYERELNEVKATLVMVKKEIEEYRGQNTTDSPDETTLQSQGSETGEWVWQSSVGAGGFGEVFKAQRKGCQDIFAAKRIILRDSDMLDKQAEIVQSFFKEMKALQDCKHPRVVRYIDRAIENVRSNVHFYIIMEFMSQGSLSDVLKREGKLDELRVKRLSGQLLEGLQYLHRKGVIHRDIKCSNILMDESGDVKLADFGCVKILKSKFSSGAKMTGTAWWMAPELVHGGKQSDAASEKSDVWSVGATVVEMLTGKRPFSEYDEKMSVIFGLGQKSLQLDKLISGPGFSDEVQEFLRLCINWEPSERATVANLLKTPFVIS